MGYDVIGKKVRLIFDDLGQSRSKVGVIISKDELFIQIQTDNKKEFIPISKLIRLEVLDGR